MAESGRTVLVIDDEPEVAEVVCFFLEAEGFHPIAAHNATDGLRLARTDTPSLIFCDWSMPRRGGQDFLRELRAQTDTAHLPVVVMSGYGLENVGKMGAQAFLQKPFNMDQLLALAHSFTAVFAPDPQPLLQPAR